MGPCVQARLTVTFGGRKVAHATEPGFGLCGEVRVADIGIVHPPGAAPAAHLLTDASPLVPAVSVHAHKNKYGHVGVLAGRALGAARLAALASLRAGAGLATVLHDGPLVLPEPELMVRAVGAEPLTGLRALVVGPGLGHERSSEAHTLLAHAAEQDIPAVVDAEAIDVVARTPLPRLRAVATPHPGEAARALGVTSADVQRDRLAAAAALHERLGADVVVVLKGSAPIVAVTGQPPILVEGATPALAVAGSGDVLAGCIAALLAQGLSCVDAALLGVWAHQRAGKALASRGVARGWLASDIAAALPAALVGTTASRPA